MLPDEDWNYDFFNYFKNINIKIYHYSSSSYYYYTSTSTYLVFKRSNSSSYAPYILE